ncbi:MAG: hypothetical protein VX755_08430, partial [Pseudomonadota bacterium]|nr:hypothetical protein [Pseudomonadota bacterium]
MSALPIIITTAGLTALVNAQNTGASNVVIASLGVSPTQIAASAATAAIPGEVKRIAGVAGQVVADDQIYISAADQTEDTYTVRTIGLYLNTGVLFGVYSQAAPLLEKAAPAMAVLEAAIKLSAPQANAITFEGGGWLNPQASETVQGVVKLAPLDEAVLGADHSKAVTPKGLKAVTTALMAAIQATFDQIAQTLAGKANTVHQHGAGDVTSGVFDEARIPSLPLARITGLIDALAGKAAAVHQHAAADVTSGVFDVGRIPALAMEKITGLANALAGKAPINTPTFEGGGGPEGGEVRLKRPTSETAFEADVAIDLYKNQLRIFETTGALRGLFFDVTELLGGIASKVWHSGNFNPATKATLGTSATFADVRVLDGAGGGVVYLGDLAHFLVFDGFNYVLPNAPLISAGGTVWTSATFNPADKVSVSETNLGRTGAGPLVKMNSYQDYGDRPTGWTAMLTPDSAWSPGGYGYFMKTGRRDNNGGWGGVYVGRATDPNTKPDLWVGMAITRDHQPYWARLWSDANFDPGSKVTILNPDGNAHTMVMGWNGARFVATVDGLVSHAFLHTADAASSIGASGYAVIPGTGLMIQWGVVTSNIAEGSTHAYLPVAFGGGCLVALATPRNPGSNVNSDYYMQVVGRYQDRIVFFANRANGSAGNLDGYEWIALGRVNGSPDPAYSSGGGGGGGG